MSKQIPIANEFISLTVMLLMIAALAAGQADATLHNAPDIEAPAETALTTHRK